MAPQLVHRLSVLCCFLSLGFVYQSMNRYAFTEQPRKLFSSLFILTGLLCFLAGQLPSCLVGGDRGPDATPDSSRFPGARFIKKYEFSALARPSRYFPPSVALLITARLEILYFVAIRQQCSAPGLESWICVFLFGYIAIAWRGSLMNSRLSVDEDDLEDPWRTILDDMRHWMTGPRAKFCLGLAGNFLLSYGTYLTYFEEFPSTYICFPQKDSRLQVVGMQHIGVALDATITVLLWRMFTRTKNFRSRVRCMAYTFTTSSFLIALLWLVSCVATRSQEDAELTLNNPTIQEKLIVSWALTIFCVSSSYTMDQGSLELSAAVATAWVGVWRASKMAFGPVNWMHSFRWSSSFPMWLCSTGLILFLCALEFKKVLGIGRKYLILSMYSLLIIATILTAMRQPSGLRNRHPIKDLIYEARIAHDRWLIKAATSNSLETAVKIYEERHDARRPPPGFEVWYEMARNSTVIDDFEQIDKDLSIFWSLSPAMLRERAQLATTYPGVGSITIKHGEATASDPGDETKNQEMGKILDMTKKFSRYLPDMTLPINTGKAPRVILPRSHEQGDDSATSNLVTRKSSVDESGDAPHMPQRRHTNGGSERRRWYSLRTDVMKPMLSRACPQTSLINTGQSSSPATFCFSCASLHSRGQFMDDWTKSLNVCNQPDLEYLHSFFMTEQSPPSIAQLIPLFGNFKTPGFVDILLPFAQPPKTGRNKEAPFGQLKDSLFWRGTIGEHTLSDKSIRGSQTMRLLHLLTKPDANSKVTMVLPMFGSDKLHSKQVLASEVNKDLSFNVGIDDYSACSGSNCGLTRKIYGQKNTSEDSLSYQYVLLTDEDNSPPAGMLAALTSSSLPFLSTIFQTWYSSRLTPWLHFVPLDVRYHALHTSLLYFRGTTSRAKMDHLNTYIQGHAADAEWIAQQGQRWASKALGNDDAELYFFRLLLEWGRLIDDERDKISVLKAKNG